MNIAAFVFAGLGKLNSERSVSLQRARATAAGQDQAQPVQSPVAGKTRARIGIASGGTAQERIDAFVAQFNFSDAQRKDIEKQRQVVSDMEQAAKQAVRDRKGAASERVARIKQELEMLKRFAAADPKGAAKRAAQLARELGAAAKEYAKAGSASDAGGSAAEASSAGGDAAATGSVIAANAGIEAAASPLIAAEAASGEPKIGENGAADKATPPTSTPLLPDAAAQDPAKKTSDKDGAKVRGLTAEQQERAAEAKGDSDFAAMVKQIAAELKALIERGARAARQEGKDDQADMIGREGASGLRAAENAVFDIQNNAIQSLVQGTGFTPPPAMLLSINV